MIPETLGACADRLYEIRQKRLEQQKIVDALRAEETELKQHIIDTLPKSEASGVAGARARVTITQKKVPQVKDWDAFYNHIKETGNFELLQRRVGDPAVRERWDNGESVPGVEHFNLISLSINKVN